MQDREQESAGISRRKLVAGAAVGAGALLGVPGVASAARRAPAFTSGERRLHRGLAAGKYGGPTNFKGAERYQYPLDSEEGRAISALRAMKKAGKAPDTIVVQTLDFAKPQFEKAFPKGALSITSQFFKETGIKIKFTVTTPADEYATNTRNASSRNKSFDAVTFAIEEMGDFAEAKLLKPLDAYVAKYKPMWADSEARLRRRPEHGQPVLEVQRQDLRGRLRQRHAAVLLPRRPDGRPEGEGGVLGQVRQEAARRRRPGTSTRRSRRSSPARTSSCTATSPTNAPFWCAVNWNERFVCSAAPNNLYFKPDGSANVNTPAGVRAFAEMLKQLEYHEPGSLEKDWIAQYKVMGARQRLHGPVVPEPHEDPAGQPRLRHRRRRQAHPHGRSCRAATSAASSSAGR